MGEPKVKRNNHQWTTKEDAILVELGDNGFRPSFHKHLENKMLEKMPRCTLKVTPHIESRVKQLKKHHNAITKMIAKGLYNKTFPYFHVLGHAFGKDLATWENDEDLIIIVEGMDKEDDTNDVESESDGANKKKIVCEELKKMEGLITQQRARVGCLIRKDINMVEYFLVVDYEDKMMIV
ncbi:hypothetical protein HKD37_01G000952 [Glycine soja]